MSSPRKTLDESLATMSRIVGLRVSSCQSIFVRRRCIGSSFVVLTWVIGPVHLQGVRGFFRKWLGDMACKCIHPLALLDLGLSLQSRLHHTDSLSQFHPNSILKDWILRSPLIERVKPGHLGMEFLEPVNYNPFKSRKDFSRTRAINFPKLSLLSLRTSSTYFPDSTNRGPLSVTRRKALVD